MYVSVCSLWSGLCPFSELVCDLLPRRVSWFAEGALPEEYLSHDFDEHCLEDTRLGWCLSYPSEGAPLISGRYVSW